jgi:hypothetical protein
MRWLELDCIITNQLLEMEYNTNNMKLGGDVKACITVAYANQRRLGYEGY